MLKSTASNEDPGGNAEPRFHEGLEHRPLVTITNSKKEVVQLSPEVVYLHSGETLSRLKAALAGLNSGSINGGLLREPAGDPEEGTLTHAYAVTFADQENAGKVEAALAEKLAKFAETVPGAEFRGFVPDAKTAIYRLLTERALEEHNRRLAGMSPPPRLRVVGGDRDLTDTDGADATVELDRHETAARDDEQGEDGRDTLGARSTQA